MDKKVLEILDSMTFIPVVAINTDPENEGQRYLLRRAGYGPDGRTIILVNLNDCRASNDPYGWPNSRTMRVAHAYIEQNFDSLSDGDVIDVEFILGESDTAKKSERHPMRVQEKNTETVIVLDRERWARGKANNGRKANVLLSNKDGSMCCLGYCMATLGIPRRALLNIGDPHDSLIIHGSIPKDLRFMVGKDDYCCQKVVFFSREIVSQAIRINDLNGEEDITDESRVDDLNGLFKPHNIRFVLVETAAECEKLGGLPADYSPRKDVSQ